MEKMKCSIFFVVSCSVLLFCSSSAYAKTKSPPAPPVPTPTPAPAPAPHYVNLTDLFSVAGPFHTFLGYLTSTKAIDTFQNQANNTEEGITIFVPRDDAFKSLKKPSLSNLTQDQLKQLILYHALPHYYSLSEFRNLSQMGAVSTFAGGQYSLNFTDVSGTIHLDSGWTQTKVSSSVYSTDPVAVYQVNRVLLPEAIFGTDIPPMSAPAPSPETSRNSTTADAPAADSADHADASSPKSSHKNSAHQVGSKGTLSQTAIAVAGMVGALFL